jgi:HupE / UreJ protein
VDQGALRGAIELCQSPRRFLQKLAALRCPRLDRSDRPHLLFGWGGVDHLLFVLALLFLVRGVERIFLTIIAFTAAHSITLVAATLGWIHVPRPPIEAMIALSIVFVAAEIVRDLRGTPGLTARARRGRATTEGDSDRTPHLQCRSRSRAADFRHRCSGRHCGVATSAGATARLDAIPRAIRHRDRGDVLGGRSC